MKRSFFIFYLLVILFACNSKQPSQILRHDREDIYTVAPENVEMNKAIENARAKFRDFDKAFLSNNFDTSTFAIKAKFLTPDGGNEHLWIRSLKKKNGNYFGIVDDDPESTKMVKQGESIKIKTEDITDWLFAEHDTLRGGYTIKAIRRMLTKDEQIKFDSTFYLKIVD